ncbi:MAG: nicotinate phosphoribosyltransferase [Coriobacteriia bacterium]|nr:nicotinate phosphoribosyltransferase [Coriobacteriia bacterium]
MTNTAKSALLTDLYQITMAQGFYHNDKAEVEACYYLFFRDYPFNGGYAIACGMAQIADYVQNFNFDNEDIEYLRNLNMFAEDFLQYLSELKLKVNIDCVLEGSIVFPQEPVLRVSGPILHCQLIETAILNAFNFQTLVATKASRVMSAAQCPVMEFGLRRAQGYSGGVWASRAAIVGGCSSTSDVEAGRQFNIPVAGTHAHSWVMAFENELDAFRAYAKEFANNCVLLVDTYDIEQGVKNAITVGLEMKERGQHLAGIRIDSGDLTWVSKSARKMLDEAGLTDCGIVLSNDLDEYSIKSIKNEGGSFTNLGVGTKLATAYDQAALGGVYKLAAIKKNGQWQGIMKISETSEKMTIPGFLNVRRYVDKYSKLAGDMIYDVFDGVEDVQIIVDPKDNLRRKQLAGNDYYDLLMPMFKDGKLVMDDFDTMTAQTRAKEGLATLDETQKRTLNPHTYPVGLEHSLNRKRTKLVAKIRGVKL